MDSSLLMTLQTLLAPMDIRVSIGSGYGHELDVTIKRSFTVDISNRTDSIADVIMREVEAKLMEMPVVKRRLEVYEKHIDYLASERNRLRPLVKYKHFYDLYKGLQDG